MKYFDEVSSRVLFILCPFDMTLHSVRSSLESHDQVELEAAIFATDKLCAQSRYLNWARVQLLFSVRFHRVVGWILINRFFDKDFSKKINT